MIGDQLASAAAGFIPELREVAPYGGIAFVALWGAVKVLRFFFDLATLGDGKHIR